MSKIDDYIRENNVKPSDCLYHTNRTAMSKDGRPSGSIRVLVARADSVARTEYKCPECAHSAYDEQGWKRPFSVKCEKCGFRITVPKMKQAFKKEAKSSGEKDAA